MTNPISMKEKKEIQLEITGRRVVLTLREKGTGEMVFRTEWEDRRDLSTQFFRKLSALLRRHQLTLDDIGEVSFSCDSPYFQQGKSGPIQLENLDASGKCGFTAWQTGETLAAVINFARR